MLHWTPQAFWSASVYDVIDAYDGYALANGIKKKSSLTDDDITELRKMIDEDERHSRADSQNKG